MRGSATRALLPAAVVLALVGVVAVASTGSTPAGTADARPPGDTLLDTILSVGLLLLIPGAVLLVYGLLQRKAIAREIASGRYRRASAVAYVAALLFFVAVAYLRGRGWRITPAEQDEVGEGVFTGEPPTETVPVGQNTDYEPEFALVPALLVLGIVAVGLVAAYLSLRRRSAPAEGTSVSDALADILSETLDDLRAEADPRRAVIAAYARFEHVLAANGLPRQTAETPEEYLARILGDLAVGERAARRLTDLFEVAKFSDHAVDATMKEEAIGALEEVRDELRSAPAEETQPTAQPVSAT